MSTPHPPVPAAAVELAADALGEPAPGYGARAVVDAMAQSGWLCDPAERRGLDHASAAADHLLALVVAADPTFVVTADFHDATVALVQAVVSALAVVGRGR